MKVYEIISETWYNPLTWGQSAAPTVNPVTKAVAAVTPKEMAAALKNIKKDPAAYLKVINKRIEAGEFAKDIEAAKSAGTSRMGMTWWGVFKAIGFATACYELWAHLAAVEADYRAGQRGQKNPDPTGLVKDMPGDASMEFNEGEYKEWRRFYIGLWEAQVALPLIVGMIKKISNVFMLTRAIVGILSVAGSLATFGGAFLGFVSFEVLTQAVQWWLMSPQGQEWAVKNLFGPLTLAGEVGEDAWLIFYKGVSGFKKAMKSGDMSDLAKGDNYYDVTKAERDKDPRLAKRDAELGNADNVQSGTNSVVVGGVRITDKDGYLLPYADSWGQVKYAIQYDPKEKAKYDAVVAKGKPPATAAEKQPGYGSFDSM